LQKEKRKIMLYNPLGREPFAPNKTLNEGGGKVSFGAFFFFKLLRDKSLKAYSRCLNFKIIAKGGCRAAKNSIWEIFRLKKYKT
jgi:hypothetical protein